MDVFEAIQKRHSVRRFRKEQVPEEVILRVLEAASLAPSAANSQPWYFVVVNDDEKKRTIAKSGLFARFIARAPVVVVGCGDREASPRWYSVDVAIAMEHVVLEAMELGLGTCWVGSFGERVTRQILGIPERYEVVALLALGYPEEGRDLGRSLLHFVRRRKKMEDIAGFNKYGGVRLDRQ